MPNYFKNFKNTFYRFGDKESPVLFKNISSYVDIIDQFKDDLTVYEKYTIVSGDRPDTVSYNLYGTVDYYWTLYYLNENIRESGWPLNDREIYEVSQSSYPYWTVTTETNIAASKFTAGTLVRGNTSTVEGVVVRKRLDLGQIIINIPSTNKFQVGEQLRTLVPGDPNPDFLTVKSITKQYDSVHHYEDTNGERVDIDPFDQTSTNGLIPVTFADRIIQKNQSLKEIKVIKKSAISAINTEFQKLIKQ